MSGLLLRVLVSPDPFCYFSAISLSPLDNNVQQKVVSSALEQQFQLNHSITFRADLIQDANKSEGFNTE